jgi:signal transduction histidine kinase
MKRNTGYIWAVLLLLSVLIVDAYYQIRDSQIPIWQTEWFWWRAAGLAVIIIILASYFLYKVSLKRKSEVEKFKIKLMETQEAEWKRLAGELHDSVGQNLSAVNIYLQQNIKSLSEGSEEQENLKAVSNMLIETLEEVRRISTKLYPQQIERLGLTIAIQAMVTKLTTTTGIHFTLGIDNIDNLFTKENEIYFYRIIQEALNNIIKHSGAKNVGINITRAILFVNIDIVDDGIGFDTGKLKSGGTEKLGFGLLNLDERIRLVNGTYKFSSQPDKGTTFHVTIPVRKRK